MKKIILAVALSTVFSANFQADAAFSIGNAINQFSELTNKTSAAVENGVNNFTKGKETVANVKNKISQSKGKVPDNIKKVTDELEQQKTILAQLQAKQQAEMQAMQERLNQEKLKKEEEIKKLKEKAEAEVNIEKMKTKIEKKQQAPGKLETKSTQNRSFFAKKK